MGQMFDHELNPIKGWPNPAALDKVGALDTAVDAASTVNAGMCMSFQASNGKLITGLPAASKVTGFAPMPLFTFQNATDFDVQVDAGSSLSVTGVKNLVGYAASDAASTSAVSSQPVLGTLVAVGGYELETTEFIGTPTTGVVLTSPTTATDATNHGKLKIAAAAGTIAAGTILCGVVSNGVVASDMPSGPSRLRFWPIYDVIWTTPT